MFLILKTCTADWIKAENKHIIQGFEAAGEFVDLIDSDYQSVVEKGLLLIPDKIKKLIVGKNTQTTTWVSLAQAF